MKQANQQYLEYWKKIGLTNQILSAIAARLKKPNPEADQQSAGPPFLFLDFSSIIIYNQICGKLFSLSAFFVCRFNQFTY